jgi:putative radical SAM enzyme (TIGR03279 family)
LRKSLYLKDEDYRHSFLHGNYITLTGITKKEMNKIIRTGLSPLYISVHATDPAVRIRMLNNRKAGDILAQLGKLENSGIAFHTQIVVCPGMNDGKVLKKTVHDLLAFKEGLLSVAVVPVGITKHRKNHLRPVSSQDARSICSMVETLSEQDKRYTGRRRLFIADEFLLKAGFDIPERSYYEEYPQIENGVGLLSLLINEWKKVRVTLRKRITKVQHSTTKLSSSQRKRYLILTSASAQPFIGEIITELNRLQNKVALTVEPVMNNFFGDTVTVAGLLAAHDIIQTVKKTDTQWDSIVLPGIVLNYRGYTLDGFSPARIAKKLKAEVTVVNNISGLTDFILGSTNEQKRK